MARYLGAFGVPEENFRVDLTIARGLDYYTGTVYETAMPSITRRIPAPSAPADAMTIWPNTTPTSPCPARASPSVSPGCSTSYWVSRAC